MTRLPKRLAGLWALCFFLLSWSVEAAGVHACPHHTRIGRPATAAVTGDHHHGDHAPAPASHEQHGGCTCESGCPSTSGATLPRAAEIALPVVAPVDAVPLEPATDAPAPHHFAHFLPFAQAPPILG